MPDNDGRILGAFFGLSPDRHNRLFPSTSSNNEVEIEWEPDFSLDGAVFTPECDCRDHLDCDDAEGCKIEDLKNPKS